MKGVKKLCCGLLLVCSIMLGLSFAGSSDANAKQYSIDSFLSHGLAFPTTSNTTSSYGSPYFEFVDASLVTHPRNTSYLWTVYDSSTGKCKYDNSYKNPGYFFSGNNLYFDGNFLPPFQTNVTPGNSLLCHTMLPYGFSNDSITIPAFDSDSVPFDKLLSANSMLPYNFMYNTMPLNATRESDGVEYISKFDLSELLNNVDFTSEDFVYYTDNIKRFDLPINFDSSLESLTAGTSVTLSFALDFAHSLSSSEASALTGSATLSYSLLNDSSDIPLTCSSSFTDSIHRVAFLCSTGHLSSDLPAGSYGISLSVSSSSVLSSEKQPLYFSNVFVTLNSDPTPGGNGSFGSGGSFPNVAPGVPTVDNSNADWFSSLTNLFHFNFTNPFQPLFSMFSPDNNCASIPTLAGMLHSEETTVCPWFSSQTRSILTPVLSLASMMLLFGFAVRWLGARSGNFVEDAEVDSGGLHFANRYRRKK